MDSFSKYIEMAVGRVAYDMPDSKAVNSNTLNAKFVDVLKRHPDFTFNFIFSPKVRANFDWRKTTEGYERIDQEVSQQVTIQGHITVVITTFQESVQNIQLSDYRAKIMPLTPWTRIHRACHGFIEYGNNGGRYGNIQKQAFSEFNEFFDYRHINYKHAFKFKSAGEHGSGVSARIELYRELLTEYIWNGGKIRTDPTWISNEDKALLERICHQVLTAYVGKVLVEGIDFT